MTALAVQLNGTDQYLSKSGHELAWGAGVNLIAGCWVYQTDWTKFEVPMGVWNPVNNRRVWTLAINTPISDQRFDIRGSGNGSSLTVVSADSLGVPATNTWYFLFGWYRASDGQLGIRVGTSSTAHAADTDTLSGGLFDTAGADPIVIGSRAGGDLNFWTGRIDESFLAIPDPFPSDISDVFDLLWNGGSGRRYGSLSGSQKEDLGLISWWPLDEASGDRIDVHGGNDLTPTGGPGNAAGHVGSGAARLPISGMSRQLTRGR